MAASPEIALIVARARNGVIGRNGKLPWHLPADLKRFKSLTMGSPMVMGRKTFDSLPGRDHIVLTRDPSWTARGADVVHSLQEAIARAKDMLWVIGGAEIFELFLPLADRIELTEVVADVEGDTVMPDPRARGPWRETWSEEHAAEAERPAYRFVTLEKA